MYYLPYQFITPIENTARDHTFYISVFESFKITTGPMRSVALSRHHVLNSLFQFLLRSYNLLNMVITFAHISILNLDHPIKKSYFFVQRHNFHRKYCRTHVTPRTNRYLFWTTLSSNISLWWSLEQISFLLRKIFESFKITTESLLYQLCIKVMSLLKKMSQNQHFCPMNYEVSKYIIKCKQKFYQPSRAHR